MGVHTTGTSNIAIGSSAMDGTNAGSNSLGSTENIFIGKNAGGGTWSDAASNYNVAIGNSSMDAGMNGALYNTAIGHNAASALTTGDQNVMLGAGAGFSINTGQYNVLIGVDASNLHTDVNNLVSIGWKCC